MLRNDYGCMVYKDMNNLKTNKKTGVLDIVHKTPVRSLFYVTALFRPVFMWIMWITSLITLQSASNLALQMWITFHKKMSTKVTIVFIHEKIQHFSESVFSA